MDPLESHEDMVWKPLKQDWISSLNEYEDLFTVIF